MSRFNLLSVDSLMSAATWAVALAGIALGGVLIRDMLPRKAEPAPVPRSIANWAQVSGAGNRIGPGASTMQIVIFSDYQCPSCAVVHAELVQFQNRFANDVSIIYRHFPLEAIHPFARDAALTAECAASQDRFESYSTALFQVQDSIGIKPWFAFASEAGVPDGRAFAQCVAQQQGKSRVAADIAAGQSVSLDATPTLIVNGTLYPSPLSTVELEALLTTLSVESKSIAARP
ncbi:MAG: thioredoxin domain-containing protein [Phycisphaerae bacterium]|nr:thioredoxin domain-containing protein [Gemmatimonadaceae bacterium]